jgi:hypothetical protein
MINPAKEAGLKNIVKTKAMVQNRKTRNKILKTNDLLGV